MEETSNTLEKDKIISLVKILESNSKLLDSYKKILKKIEKMEDEIIRKFKDKEEENKFLEKIVDTSNDYYFTISKNCL
jgi:vacuolar-type H+-ATPase subunit E/Vma4